MNEQYHMLCAASFVSMFSGELGVGDNTSTSENQLNSTQLTFMSRRKMARKKGVRGNFPFSFDTFMVCPGACL